MTSNNNISHHPISKCNLQYIPCIYCHISNIDTHFQFPTGQNPKIDSVQDYLEKNVTLRDSNHPSVQHHLYHRLHQFYLEYLNGNISREQVLREYQKSVAFYRGFLIIPNDVNQTVASKNVLTKWKYNIHPIYYSQWDLILQQEQQYPTLDHALQAKSSIIGPDYTTYFKQCADYFPPALKPLVRIAVLRATTASETEHYAKVLNQYTQVYRLSTQLLQHENIRKFINNWDVFREIYGDLIARHLLHCYDMVSLITKVKLSSMSSEKAILLLNVAAGFLKHVSQFPLLMTKTEIDSLLVQQMIFAYFENMKLPPAYIMNHLKNCLDRLSKERLITDQKVKRTAEENAHLKSFVMRNELLQRVGFLEAPRPPRTAVQNGSGAHNT